MTTDRTGTRISKVVRMLIVTALVMLIGGCALAPASDDGFRNVGGPIPSHVITNPDVVSGKFDHSCGKNECEDTDPTVTKHGVDGTTKPGTKAP